MSDRVYLDWNATTPLRTEARVAMLAAMDVVGNPSSVHAQGRAARAIVEQARGEIAALVGADPRRVVFTSGGTEANALALSPNIEIAGDTAARGCLLFSAIEHPSVRAGGRFACAEEIPVGSDGVVDLGALERRTAELAADDRARPLISIMHANNETGVIQPIAAAADIVHAAGGILHVDAVQTTGRVSCEIKELRADLVTISAHKLGGPKGIGALVWRQAELRLANPLIKGGGQERGLRAGTENVAAIAGFGAAAAAARAAMAAEQKHTRELRDRLEAGLKSLSPDAAIFGAEAERLPNTMLVARRGMKAETAVIAFDLEGIAVSSGAACSSGKVQASHVLAAMGVDPELAGGAIRVSIGYSTTEGDLDRFLEAWRKMQSSLFNRGQGLAA